MKIKTLKDLAGNPDEHKGYLDCSSKNLKQEAIKEVKFAKSSKEGTKGLFGGGVNFMFTKDVIGYIKWKFNINEEDLK